MAARSIAYAMARLTWTSWKGCRFSLNCRKSVRLDGNSFRITPGADCSDDTADQGGNSSTPAWPPFSWRMRVLSSGTFVHVTLSRYGLPFCQ